MEYIAFDVHKRYTYAVVEDGQGRVKREGKIPHEPGALAAFLAGCEPGSPVAVETVGNWYWIVDEIEKAGLSPRLVHAAKAKLMLGAVNKTDKLDARGLNKLQRAGTLPTVWIPSGDLRDKRELTRTRMLLVRQRTQLKQRIQATLAKYGLGIPEVQDVFGVRGRKLLRERMEQLPPETRAMAALLLEQVEALDARIAQVEARMKEVLAPTPEVELLQSLPGVGFILATVISLEVGDVRRFPSPEHLASYAGTVPRVQQGGGKVRHGKTREDVNRYLKWAYAEAANVIARHAQKNPYRHVSRLYLRIRERKGHQKAVGAVSRHLAEATWWVLVTQQPYQEPTYRSRGGAMGA